MTDEERVNRDFNALLFSALRLGREFHSKTDLTVGVLTNVLLEDLSEVLECNEKFGNEGLGWRPCGFCANIIT